MELYHDALECEPDELRLRVLGNLQRLIPFDFGVWGGGRADSRLVSDLTVLNQSEAILEDWEAVAQQDDFCDLTLNRLGSTARFDDVPDYREGLAFNEHWRRFNASHMMATIVGEKTYGYVSFVGLCAEGRPLVFSDAERTLKQMLMPHLSQALRMNRELWAGRAVREHDAVVLVDGGGWILTVQGPFRDLAEREWGKQPVQLPALIMDALKNGERWIGKTLEMGMLPLGTNFLVHLSEHHAPLAALSAREREVAQMFASGQTYKQVARALGTSPYTVRNQITRIYEKLEISNKAELAQALARKRPQ
ncbi:helix-turn-helix transcriptional regulator [Celeribacter sp.]|uniref:helix-turn-helix transcriptional regulator n=1 Tax=Celeribacter sp. TaxID=1890673 RepID=UPI003A8CA2A0